MLRTLSVATTLLAGFCLTATASSIKFDINGSDNNFGSAPGATYTGLGAPGDPGTIWNGLLHTGGNLQAPGSLVDGDGNATQIGSFVTDTRAGFAFANANDLMADYTFRFPDDTTASRVSVFTDTGSLGGGGLQIDGISIYDVYVYAAGDTAGQFSTFEVQGDVASTTGGGPFDGVFDLGADYLVFSDVTATPYSGGFGGAGFEINLIWTGNSGFAPFNGFSVVRVGVIPEPASAAILGLAAAFGAASGRFRQR